MYEDESEKLRTQAQSRLAAIVESSDDAIVSKTLDGVIRTWNKGAERIFGWTSAEVVGKPITIIIPDERLQEEPRILQRLRSGERVDHFETVRKTKDGRLVEVSVTISPIRDSDGHIIGASKIARDITFQKRVQKELEAAKSAADQANRLKDEFLESERAARADAERASQIKDEFLATLSHELRTPLSAILGWSRILAQGSVNAEDLAEGLRTIERNARAQTQIIEDLLDMSRIVSGKVRLDVQRVDLGDVVRQALETVTVAAEAKGVRIQSVLDPLAGPVSGDPSRLQQVLWNILTNAVKFTFRGGRIQVLLERVNSHLEVSVIDTGEGISPEFLPHVFDRFRQSDASAARKHGGLGLGLAIAKQLVELHGGTIRAKSAGLGQGATFTLNLPVLVVHPEPGPATQRRHPTAVSMLSQSNTCEEIAGVKVLVVDDEPDSRALIKRLLEDCKAVVFAAGSAAEGMELLRSQRPDVLVSDIGMPVEDGHSMMRRIRALEAQAGGNTPAIALTAYARSEDRIRALMAGFQYHVAKPVEPTELITVIASLVRHRRSGG